MSDFHNACPTCEGVRRWVDDRLFYLRQQPELTIEQEALSHIQLILHEADELQYTIGVRTGSNTVTKVYDDGKTVSTWNEEDDDKDCSS